jgi:hypothetical protein
MPKTHTITTYQFDELDAKAQNRALGDCRDVNVDGGSEWYDATIEMAAEIADMLGIDTRVKKVRCGDGKERCEPAIYFRGFASQGDGACFEGTYQHAEDALERVTAELPREESLHAIAAQLEAIQAANAGKIIATIKHRGHYYHEMSAEIEVSHDDGDELTVGTEDEVVEALRNVMRWIYRTLEHEHEWLTADEQVRDTITANEYEFLQDGRRYV